jgi:hypothetical protein
VFEWHKKFSEGREHVEEDRLPGHLVKMDTDEHVGKVRILVRNHSSGIRMLVEELNMDKEMVQNILVINLNVRKACAKMIPKSQPVFSQKTNINA